VNGSPRTRVLLSGGIGAGKSVVADLLSARGIPVIHADAIGHLVLQPEGEAFGPVSAWWPEVVAEGRIDRSRLAAIVFGDPGALEELESMTHPAIRARIESMLSQHDTEQLVVVEIPLLTDFLGSGWLRVVVDAPEHLRRARLAERGMPSADIDARMAAQPTAAEWRNAADYVIDNDGTQEELRGAVERLLGWLASG